MSELLTTENNLRYVVFPIKYHDIWAKFQLHRKTLWNETEIDLSNDYNDWCKLTNNEKHFIKYILAFFASSDGIVLENLSSRFMTEIQIPEVRCFYSIQSFMETIHGITYSMLIDTYIKDLTEKDMLFRAIETIPTIQKKAEWAQKWITTTNDSLGARLIAFSCVEGIFFSGAFCCIYWIKSRGIGLQGLCKSNDFIARDEGIHTDFSCLLYTNYIQNKLSEEVVHSIIKDAVSIEEEFIIDSLECNLLGMNSDLMREYIKFVADRLSRQLGYSNIYNAKQPFAFMDQIFIDAKENFFEGRVTNYQATVEVSINDSIDYLKFDEDF